MSRPTEVVHPLATLRAALRLGRTQLALRLGISRPALEKIERSRNRFSAALRNRAHIATGVCPGWLSKPDAPIHTADGYPMTPAELTRWEAWQEGIKASPDPSGAPTAVGGRPLGSCYRKECCLGPDRLLVHGPLEVAPAQSAKAKRFQKSLEEHHRRFLVQQLVDRARGIAHRALADWDEAEKPLWELVSAMERLFPDVTPMPDPTAEAEAKAFLIQSQSVESVPPTRISSKIHPNPAGSTATDPTQEQDWSSPSPRTFSKNPTSRLSRRPAGHSSNDLKEVQDAEGSGA